MMRLDKLTRQLKVTELLTAVVLAVVGQLLVPTSHVHAAKSGQFRVHWVASNWAAFHGLARQCGERLELDEAVSTTHSHSRIWPLHAVVDREGKYVQFYTKQTRVDNFVEFDKNLAAAEFDVLAVAIQLKMVGKDTLRPQYEKLIAYAAGLAKKQNAQLVFTTYGNELDGDNRIEGRKRLIEMAERVNAKVCPWWETMRLMKKRHPEVRLWDRKVGGHPSREMTYALSYAFYFTLTGRTLANAPVSLQVGDWAPEDEPIELAAAAARAQIKVASDAVQFIRTSSERQPNHRYQSLDGHPADHLPPYIKQVSGIGERPEWSHDGKRILFVEKPMGEVYELDLTTGLIHPKTRHFSHHGFTRANYLANGDILLSGPAESFDATDRESRRVARHRCWLSVMPSTDESKPIALGTMAAEGPAVSRKQMKIAWTHRDKQDPTLGKNHARHFVADIVYESGKPKLANQRVVFDSRQLPFRLGDASLETQGFAGKDDRHLVFSVYQIEGGHNTDTYIVDTASGEFKNLTRSPSYYDEPEGVFPDGLHVCVEHAPSEHSAWPLSDIYKLKLDGSGEMQRLTSFSDFKGYKATQGVVSDDGKKLCFQIGKSGDEAGVGYGFFVMDLQAAEKELEPFRSYASHSMPREYDSSPRKISKHEKRQDATLTVQRNVVVEWSLKSSVEYDKPMLVELDAIVTADGDQRIRLPGFWAGGNEWRFRFSSSNSGELSYTTVCSNKADEGLHDRRGKIQVTEYTGSNPLLKHGPLELAANGKRFQHADGTPFFWLADSWWHGMTSRLDWPSGFQSLTADRRDKGFSVIQFAIAFPCDIDAYDPRGANEAGHAWTPNFGEINPAYFELVDQRIDWLVRQELVPNIVGMWGYYLPMMGEEKARQHWRYLVARYGAYPVTWTVCGESTLTWYLLRGDTDEKSRQRQKGSWGEIAKSIKQVDPFQRLRTVHPGPASGRLEPLSDMSSIDIIMLQPGHHDSAVARSMQHRKQALQRYADKPVMIGEACFEGMNGECKEKIQRMLFWSSVLSGAPGHCYGVDAIWQFNTLREPFGKSPSGHVWGNTPWEIACKWPGSTHVGMGRKILEDFPWQRLRPSPDRVEPVGDAKHPRDAFAASVDDDLVMIYLPNGVAPWDRKYVANSLATGIYTATYIDPLSGKRQQRMKVKPDSGGDWRLPAAPILQDWLLVIERGE